MTADTLTDILATTPHAPTYPAHWRLARMGDFVASRVVSLTNGFAQGGFNEDGQGVPHLRPFNVTDDGRIDLEHIKSVPAPRADSSYWIQQGDIIFNNTNSEELVGKTAYFPFDGKFVLSNHMTRIRVVDSRQIDAAWLAYQFLLQWDHRVFKALCRRHVGQASISLDKLSNLTLPLPPLAEQRAIARILRAAQDAIAARRREVTLERERKAALMQRLFTHGTSGEPTKQTEIGEMPQSWQVLRFSEVVDIVQGQVDPRVEPYRSLLHVGPENIEEGTGRILNPRTAADLNLISGKYLFSPNHVLYSKIRPYLRKAAIPWFDGVCSADMYPLRPHTNQIGRDFLLYALLGESFTAQVTASQDRTGIPKVNRNQLGAVRLPLPSLAEQRDIADTLAACDTHIAALEREIALHDEIFRALLEELMSGRLSALPLVEQTTVETPSEGVSA